MCIRVKCSACVWQHANIRVPSSVLWVFFARLNLASGVFQQQGSASSRRTSPDLTPTAGASFPRDAVCSASFATCRVFLMLREPVAVGSDVSTPAPHPEAMRLSVLGITWSGMHTENAPRACTCSHWRLKEATRAREREGARARERARVCCLTEHTRLSLRRH